MDCVLKECNLRIGKQCSCRHWGYIPVYARVTHSDMYCTLLSVCMQLFRGCQEQALSPQQFISVFVPS